MNNMALHQEIKLIPNFFSLYYLKNTGAAFSILGNKTILLILVSIFCLIIIKNSIKKLKRTNTLNIISLGIMTGGIIGNLFDRVLYKSVIDYLSFNIFNYSFPVFNLADIGITVGAILLIIDLMIEEKEKKTPNI
jgi:signal peptidase II